MPLADMIPVLVYFLIICALLVIADRVFHALYGVPVIRAFFDRHFFGGGNSDSEEVS